jgi:predicted Zn-dependent protease
MVFMKTFWGSMTRGFGRVVILMVSIMVMAGCATYNPATGRNEFIFISTQEEVAMGQTYHEKLSREFNIIDDERYVQRLAQIGLAVTQVSDRQDYAYQFYVIRKDELNAFTTPGGYIYVYTGLMDRLNDDQLGFVIAHEVAHCAARHVVKKFQAQMGYQFAGSLVLQRISNVSTQRLLSMSSGALMHLVFMAYSRADESEADRLGLKYMALAGFDMEGAVEALSVLYAESKDAARPPEIVNSHPDLKKRINQVREEIQNVHDEIGTRPLHKS